MKEVSFLKKDYRNWKYWYCIAKSEAIKVYFVFGLVGHSLAFNLGCGGCHDNTVRSFARNVLRCTEMYYYFLTVSMATAKQPGAIKCVAYENSSPW